MGETKNVGKFIALNPALCSVLVCCSLSRILCSFSIFNFSINLSESRSFFSTSRSFSSREKDSVEEDFFSASRRWMISSRSFVDFLLVLYFSGSITLKLCENRRIWEIAEFCKSENSVNRKSVNRKVKMWKPFPVLI